MKHLMLISLLFSSTAFAGSGSLWCSLSSYGTPTETAARSALPYRLIQIDKMATNEIQIDIADNYSSNSEVFKANLGYSGGVTIADIAVGTYFGKREISIAVKNGKILVEDGSMTYMCEIPGDYQTDYTSYVR